jgi:hypothetical protein
MYCPAIVARLLPLRFALGEALVWRLVALSNSLSDAAAAAAAESADAPGTGGSNNYC